jgi:hypothetical protein
LRTIRLIGNRADLKGTAYVEFQPGSFVGNHWQEGSVFVTQQVFGYVAPIVSRHFPNLNPYGPSAISGSTWREVIADFRRLSRDVKAVQSVADLRKLGIGFGERGLDEQFERSFVSNTDALAQLLSHLADWLERTLGRENSVSILGL